MVFDENATLKVKNSAEHTKDDDRDKTRVQFEVEHVDQKTLVEDGN